MHWCTSMCFYLIQCCPGVDEYLPHPDDKSKMWCHGHHCPSQWILWLSEMERNLQPAPVITHCHSSVDWRGNRLIPGSDPRPSVSVSLINSMFLFFFHFGKISESDVSGLDLTNKSQSRCSQVKIQNEPWDPVYYRTKLFLAVAVGPFGYAVHLSNTQSSRSAFNPSLRTTALQNTIRGLKSSDRAVLRNHLKLFLINFSFHISSDLKLYSPSINRVTCGKYFTVLL